ncbi:M14 family zinc carboxypeptidase [Calditrichota bacterium]
MNRLKKNHLLLLFISVLFFLSNQPVEDEVKLYRLAEADRQIINMIERSGGSVNRFVPGQYAEIYLNNEQYFQIKNSGIELVKIPDRARLYADSLYEATKNSANPMAGYHTYQEITDTLQIWATQYSDIAELHSIGQTVLGREMWVMKISDNVSIEEAEPEFKYISTMHGDEVVGKEMMIELIRLLLNEYGSSQRITDLVNNTEIWIMPDMNFDGTEGSGRNNANGVNLNRNFPDREYGDPPYPGHPYNLQVETQNVMQFTANHNFVLSANFHGGALVANYPWDKKLPGDPGTGNYSAAPDDITFIDLALTYAERNLPMYNSPIFQNGITNGSAWYEVSGGMQDWNYFDFNCMELTLEISEVKWPAYSEIPQFWLDNKESLLAYMEKVHTGIKGIVTDSLTGLPILANVTVLETGTGVNTDPDFGDYYKVISPGIYSLLFSADGYEDKKLYNVQVDSFPATILDVQLIPEAMFSIGGQVKDIESGKPISGVEVVLTNGDSTIYHDSTGFNGSFQVNVKPDSFVVRLQKNNYFTLYDTIVISTDTTMTFEMQQIHQAIVKGIVESSLRSSPAGAIVYCQGVTDTLGGDGQFRFEEIIPGNISVIAYLFNHKTVQLDTMVQNHDSLDLEIVLEPGQNEILDDFETTSTIIYLNNGDWEKGVPASGPMNAFSGVNVWATNLSGNYSNGGLLSTLETSEIAILGLAKPTLEFYHWYDFETDKDGGNVKISTDNGQTWQVLDPMESYPIAALPAGSGNPLEGEPAYSGQQLFWKEATFNLSSYAVYPVIILRFDFGADQTGNASGWYIDDLHLFDGNVVKVEDIMSDDGQLLPSIINFPNPFNPVTTIKYKLPKPTSVLIEIYNVLGQKLSTLVNMHEKAGYHEIQFDASQLASGIYLYRIQAGNPSAGLGHGFQQVKKMVVMK